MTNTSLKGKCAYSLGQQTIQYWTVGIYIQFRHSMSTTLSNYFLHRKWKILDSDISYPIKPSTALIHTLFNRVLLLGDLEHTINWHKSVIPYATNKITLKLLLFRHLSHDRSKFISGKNKVSKKKNPDIQTKLNINIHPKLISWIKWTVLICKWKN